ncbi:MAG: ribose 5-phosphate isomerase B [Alphaproteobacteria bacterium]|jgi:ribose 5-phosphate isomerase B|nr:ribose 5-phosphate isomerase B [Alphaproteobacteria bacterium]
MAIRGTVAIGADHAGFALKEWLKARLAESGYGILDVGTHSADSVDYPDFAHAVGDALVSGKANRGVLICGTGIGVSIAANRNPAVRAALCQNVDAARLARQHNDANVLALGARLLDRDIAAACVDVFLATAYEGGRHDRRLAKLSPRPAGDSEPDGTGSLQSLRREGV